MRISDWSSDVCSSDLYGFALYEHAVVLVLPGGKYCHAGFVLCRKRTGVFRLDSLSSAKCPSTSHLRLRSGNDLVAHQYLPVYYFPVAGRYQLHQHGAEHAYPGNDHDQDATHYMGVVLDRCAWIAPFPGIGSGGGTADL